MKEFRNDSEIGEANMKCYNGQKMKELIET